MMTVWNSCEDTNGDEPLPPAKTFCELASDTVMVINSASELDQKAKTIQEYLACKKVDLTLNYTVVLTQGNLTDPNDWRNNGNLTKRAKSMGASVDGTVLSHANWIAWNKSELVVVDGKMFGIKPEERALFITDGVLPEVFKVIGDDPSKDGENVIIRSSAEIVSKVQQALAQIKNNQTTKVKFEYDAGLEQLHADALAQLFVGGKLLDGITVEIGGRLYAAKNGTRTLVEVLNTFGHFNKDDNKFEIIGDKYELAGVPGHQVLVDDTMRYGDGNGARLRVVIPTKGIYYDVDLEDVENFEHLKDYNGKINVVVMSKEHTSSGVSLPENSFGAPGDWFLDNMETLATGMKPGAKLRIINEKGEVVDPFLGAMDYPPHNPQCGPTGPKSKGIKTKEITDERAVVLAASVIRAKDEARNTSGMGDPYPIYQDPNLEYKFTPNPEFANVNGIINFTGNHTLVQPGEIRFVGSSVIKILINALGYHHDLFPANQTFPIPAQNGLDWNTLNVAYTGIVIENDFVAKHELFPHTGSWGGGGSANSAEVSHNNTMIQRYLSAGSGINFTSHFHPRAPGIGPGNYWNGGDVSRYFEQEAAAANQKFKKASTTPMKVARSNLMGRKH